MPPPDILRDEPPPDELLLVVRGGQHGLADQILERSVADCREQFGFFGISAFGAPFDDLDALNRDEPAIRMRKVIRTARCGDLRRSGFPVEPTFGDPRHFSVVLAKGTTEQFNRLRSCFGEAILNPGYESES